MWVLFMRTGVFNTNYVRLNSSIPYYILYLDKQLLFSFFCVSWCERLVLIQLQHALQGCEVIFCRFFISDFPVPVWKTLTGEIFKKGHHLCGVKSEV